MKPSIAIICPITSKGCVDHIPSQPVFQSLLPSIERIRNEVRLYFGYDHDDPLWMNEAYRKRVGGTWLELRGLTGNVTGIWNAMAFRAGPHDYYLPVNDDLRFDTDPLQAVETLDKRKGFGTVPFYDAAFPTGGIDDGPLPTFYLVGRMHFDIFGTLYPLPWTGAHQDPWIADVYRPWKASEFDLRIRCENRLHIKGPRFEYGVAEGYREAVLDGRRRVNAWLEFHPDIAPQLDAETLKSTPTLIP